jgi:uncharacterized protein (DUF1800 family)
MKFSRRQFVALGGGAVALAAGGCDNERASLRRWLGKPAAPLLEKPAAFPQSATLDPISHGLNRLTFGPRPDDYAHASALGFDGFLEEQLHPEQIDDTQCDRLVRHEFDELGEPQSTIFTRPGKATAMSEAFPALKNSSGARVGDLYEWKDKPLLESLTRSAILRAVVSRRQLHEVMVHFWSDHFNIDPSKGECKWLKVADDRDVIRAHALGRFSDLLRASAVSPAMLWYLDGRVNRLTKPGDRPNENYARELMELHTLGVHGGYTQQDVMEVARCLTGWTVRDRKRRIKGQVEFEAKAHDDGEKIVLGQKIPVGGGLRDLDRVLEIVTAHPSTARYLATKLCRRFIADEPPADAIDATARAFSESRGDIRTTLRALFHTPEFAAAAGCKLKRPFHFVVSALRATNAETDGGRPIIDALQRMGHAPFRYPTPDGYPEEGSHWTGTLLWRWNFAVSLVANQLKGTHVEAEKLTDLLGGPEALMAAVLGRLPSESERASYHASGAGAAMLLASPAFQRC